MGSPFDRNPEFIEKDNRRFRGFDPVSQSFLEAKYQTLLPAEFVEGRFALVPAGYAVGGRCNEI